MKETKVSPKCVILSRNGAHLGGSRLQVSDTTSHISCHFLVVLEKIQISYTPERIMEVAEHELEELKGP